MTSGRGRGHVTHFYILGPMSSSERMKSDISNLLRRLSNMALQRVLELHMLKFCDMEVHLGLRDLLKFREIVQISQIRYKIDIYIYI